MQRWVRHTLPPSPSTRIYWGASHFRNTCRTCVLPNSYKQWKVSFILCSHIFQNCYLNWEFALLHQDSSKLLCRNTKCWPWFCSSRSSSHEGMAESSTILAAVRNDSKLRRGTCDFGTNQSECPSLATDLFSILKCSRTSWKSPHLSDF